MLGGWAGRAYFGLAFLIHFARRRGSLYFVDCSAVSVKGARIFGRRAYPGLLDLAKEGTLVFNNVDKLNKALLPRVVQLALNGTYWSKAREMEMQSKLKVILIAEERATWLEFASGPKVAQIKVPSLRVRRQDIESMVRYELRRVTRGTGQPIPAIEPQALKRLQAYDFPNNVRELFFLVDNAYRNMDPGGTITSDLLWTAQNAKKLDLFKVNLLDIYPGLRGFLQSDWLERLNHGFTKYAFAAFVILLFVGPQTFADNFGLNLFWAWWWPGILLTYPIVGRFWCAICPFMIYGEVVQRWRLGQGAVLQKWPTRQLEDYGPWFLFLLFFGILLWEELWVLENTAYLSSCLLLLITFGAMVGSWFFERRVWCRHLCPIGGMNGLYAKLALTELRSQQGECKASCSTFHCYKGGPEEGEGQETNGCPLYSHPASLKDNKNCVLCFTCLRACPHRTVQVNLRAPGIDFGFPFLFPIPGTNASSQHEPSLPELALLFLLLGAVFCHHLQDLVVQAGAPPTLLDDFAVHSALAVARMSLGPRIFVWLLDRLARSCSALVYPDQKVLNDFVALGYSYLPLTWLASLAHYLKLGLVDAGKVLPTAARTCGFFAAGLAQLPGRSWGVSRMPGAARGAFEICIFRCSLSFWFADALSWRGA
ncbi:tyrR [Symbiodinium natans]|uniref:TyrR protein n=1 Tax=Symbiodinium natans TaxID=878477 RepID=A0A812SRC8_9DINO|nr:tyrR [Symbiodinium natans]